MSYLNFTSDWFLTLLKCVIQNKFPPTITTRFLFLAANIIYDSRRTVVNILPGNTQLPAKDMFNQLPNLKVSIPLIQTNLWIEQCTYLGLKQLFNFYNYNTTLLTETYNQHNIPYTLDPAKLQLWLSRVQSYLNLRDSDGWRSSGTFDGTPPNQGHFIDSDSIQNLNELPQPNLWCPIDIKGKKQSYLTPEWGKVKGVVSDEVKQQLLEVGRKFYNPDLESEIQEVVKISSQLTNKQKLMAEFWAGGPGTCTPPGFWIYFAIYCSYNFQLEVGKEIELYQKLTSGLFQAGILAWSLKREFLQKRPIQSIRQQPSTLVDTWQGEVDSRIWLPYQELSFVTPPFPDFVSGHSTFSGVASRILSDYFDTNKVPGGKLKLDGTNLSLLSPLFKTNHDSQSGICEITVYPNSSTIQNPNGGCCFVWNSWDEMAEEAGMSRLYGGIHYMSSNLGGLAMGRNLSNFI